MNESDDVVTLIRCTQQTKSDLYSGSGIIGVCRSDRAAIIKCIASYFFSTNRFHCEPSITFDVKYTKDTLEGSSPTTKYFDIDTDTPTPCRMSFSTMEVPLNKAFAFYAKDYGDRSVVEYDVIFDSTDMTAFYKFLDHFAKEAAKAEDEDNEL